MEIQKVSKETQKKETAINTKQRVLEAQVRKIQRRSTSIKKTSTEKAIYKHEVNLLSGTKNIKLLATKTAELIILTE